MTKTLFAVVTLVAVLAGGELAAHPGRVATAAAPLPAELPRIQSADLRIDFDKNTHSRVTARFNGKDIPLGGFSASETLKSKERSWDDFALVSQSHGRVNDTFGAGEKLTIIGKSGEVQKNLSVTIYDDAPNLAVFDVAYTNTGKSKLELLGWTNNAYTINAESVATPVPFWSYQSGSYEKRPNWIVPLKAGFSQENYLGMNDTDYGGGTPIVDVWRKDVGLGVGLLETKPRLISLPVSMPNANEARVAVQYRRDLEVLPGESIHTFRSFVAVHNGDYFQTLLTFRKLMSKQGFQMAAAPNDGFGAIWCAWGYGRNFKPQQVYDSLPTVKKMGFKWVTLDDGWQNNYGDWQLDPKKFPNGDADI
jgi:alpha-galactosidase